MQTGKLPDNRKKANVTPLHKKGPKNLVENYRPISLTSIVCKTMENFYQRYHFGPYGKTQIIYYPSAWIQKRQILRYTIN